MPTNNCPSLETLRSFSAGRLALAQCERISAHMEECPECQSRMETISSGGDTMISALRGVAHVDDGLNTDVRRLLGRIEAIGHDPSCLASGAPAVMSPSEPYLATPDAAADLGMIRDYRLMSKLGEGGMGTVYKALHARLEKVVALKVLPVERMNPAAVARFQREMRAIGKLEHPNIVGAHDAGEHEGRHFLVMEYVSGSDLSEVVRRRGPLAIADACEIVRQTAVGLQHVHEHGLVHRDIKPSNLMLAVSPKAFDPLGKSASRSISERTALIKILDLGLALLQDPRAEAGAASGELTGSSQMMGTADYMAPEQVGDSHQVDIRADIYSLGCTLYKLLAGKAPFAGAAHTTPIQKMMAHCSLPAPPIRDCRPEVPAELAAVLDRLLAKRPADRFATPAEVAAAIAPFCTGADLAALARSDGSGVAVGNAKSLDATATFGTDSRLSSALSDTAPIAEDAALGAWIAQTAAERASRPASPLANRPRGRARPRLRLAVAVVGVLLLATFVIRLQFADGTLVLKVNDPTAQVRIDGHEVEVTRSADGRTLKISVDPGTHTLSVTTPEGLSFNVSDRFALSSNGTVELTATLEPAIGAANGAANGAEPGAIPEPLGKWEMGPEPPWFADWRASRLIRQGKTLPGLIERPASIAGIRRWNVDTLWPRGMITAARYSPNGEWFAIGATDGHVRVYDARTMALSRLLPGAAFEHGAWDLAWSPDSGQLAVAADDYVTLRIWSRDGTPKFEEWGAFYSVAWNHRGDRLAEGNPGALRLRRADGSVESTLAEGRGMGPSARNQLAWSPDDQTLACLHGDGKLRLWDPASGNAEILAEDLSASAELAWSKTGWLGVADGKQLRLYDPQRGLSQPTDTAARSLAWHGDGEQVYLSWGGRVKAWNVTQQAMSAEDSQRRGWRSPLLASSPDAERVAALPNMVRVYSADLTQVLFESPELKTHVRGFAWSPDGRQLACVTPDEPSVRLWTSDGLPLGETPATHNLNAICWSPDSQLLLGVGDSGIWLGAAGGGMRRVLPVAASSASWSRDGAHVAVGMNAGKVIILDRQGNIVSEMIVGEGLARVAWSPASNRLAVHCGHFLSVCDPASGWALEPGAETTKAPAETFEPIWNPSGTELSIYREGWFDGQGERMAKVTDAYPQDWRADGKQFLAGMRKHLASGTPLAERADNGFTQAVPKYHPHGELIISGDSQSRITAWRQADLQPHWHAVLLPEQKSATFSAAGELLDGDREAVEKYLVYYLERDDGRIETLTPSDFQKLVPKAP